MDETDSRLSRMDRKIVESAMRQLPEIGERECPAWTDGTCEKTGESCSFSSCPLVEHIAGESVS